MITLLEWFDSNLSYYYVFALASLFVFAALAIFSRRDTSTDFRCEATFLAITALALFAWRWPTFLASYALSPDEGISVAGALKLTADPVPWRGFDSTPDGPLSSYLLALPFSLGVPASFSTARVIGLGLLTVALWTLYYAFKWIGGSRVGRLSLLPPVMFLSLTQTGFVHFSNEYVSICLTSFVVAGTAYLVYGSGATWTRHLAGAGAGLSIGALLFVGIRVLPMAMTLFLLVIAALWSLRRRSSADAGLVTVTTLGSICLIPGIVLFTVWPTHTLGDAIVSYVKAPLAHFGASFMGWSFLWVSAKSYAVFLVASLLLLGAGAVAMVGRRVPSGSVLLLLASGLLLVSSGYAIYHPREVNAHCLLLSVIPLSCCAGIIVHLIHDAGFWQARAGLLSFSYLALFAVPALSVATVARSPLIGYSVHNWKHPQTGPAEAIARYAIPGSRIVVWGWMPECYVQTRTLMATRDPQTSAQIVEGPYRKYYRERFMIDIQAHPPLVFVDAVGPGSWKFTDRANEGHEAFPALAAFIYDNYTIQEISGATRIYKKDREPIGATP